MHRNGVRHGGRGGIAVACALAVQLSTAFCCSAGGQVDAAPESTDLRIEPNQAVSISEAALQPSAINTNDNLLPDAAVVPPGGADVDRPSRRAARLRNARRSKLRGSFDRGSGAQGTPWYRTGIGALAIVLALVGIGFWAVRRWVPSTRSGENGVLKVVARVNLSPKHNVALVRVGRRFVLVGLAGDRVNVLCNVCDQDEVAELAARVGTAGGQPVAEFGDLLIDEAAEYKVPAERNAGRAQPVRSAGTGAAQPLSDLLRKLRELKTK